MIIFSIVIFINLFNTVDILEMPSNREENITILLVSSSKLLKNRFIEAISNESNHFSLMNKSIDSSANVESSTGERTISFNCFVSDYTVDNEDEQDDQNTNHTNYVQIIDASDKKLLTTLVEKSIYNQKNNKFFTNSIIYLYDESNTDTYAFVESINNDLSKVYPEFIRGEHITGLLCNMINAANLPGTGGTNRSNDNDLSLKMINLVDKFLSQFTNFQYVAQLYEETILGSRPVVDEDDSPNNKLKSAFDLLISRFLPGLLLNKDAISIKSTENSLKSSNVAKLNRQKVAKSNYKGEMMHNLRNGFGIYIYENKFFRYEGEWRNGVKHGNGKLIMKDGSFYEGEFRDGEINGKGYKFDSTKQTEFTGEFFEGAYQGKGILRCKNKYVYEGDFYENLKHGYGEFNEFKVNQNYKGQWYFNKRHGQGVQRYSDGSMYTGDWIRDKRQGHGEFEMLDGTLYDVILFYI